jgi:hypothetical protein
MPPKTRRISLLMIALAPREVKLVPVNKRQSKRVSLVSSSFRSA